MSKNRRRMSVQDLRNSTNYSPCKNPYNFVPWDEPIKTNEPIKKLSSFGALSGSIECILKAETPLMIGGKRNENKELKEIDFFRIGGKLAIPATSLKGMIRSVLETIANACYSVFDEDKLDYRDPYFASNLAAGQVIQGRKIQRMERGWIAMSSKNNVVRGKQDNGQFCDFKLAPIPANKKSGDKVWIKYKEIDMYQPSNPTRKPIRGKFYLVTHISDTPEKDYVEGIYKITGESIKDKNGNSLKKRERIFFNANKDDIYTFSKEEEDDYKYILEEQKKRWEADKTRFDFLEKNPLSEGSLVYFKPESDENGNKIARFISRVEVPRLRYEKSRGDLLPEKYHKCSDPNNLCLACRLFGFVQDNERLSGRVSFTDANHKSGNGENPSHIPIKILGSPHPTSYNFYIKDPTNISIVRNYDGYIIQDGKGKIARDKEHGQVKIRGRKFYYHQPNDDNLKRYKANETDPTNLRSLVKPVLKDNEFQFYVNFRNLSEFELGLLLYAIKLEGNLRHKLGMGKSIGFGTVQITINSLKLTENPESHYSTFGETEPNEAKDKIENYIEEFKKQIPNFDKLLNIQKLRIILDKCNARSDAQYPPNGYKWYMDNRNKPLPLL